MEEAELEKIEAQIPHTVITKIQRDAIMGFMHGSRKAGIAHIIYCNLDTDNFDEYKQRALAHIFTWMPKPEAAKLLDAIRDTMFTLDEAAEYIQGTRWKTHVFASTADKYKMDMAVVEELYLENQALKDELVEFKFRQHQFINFFTGIKQLILRLG